jgi:uncharacterized protein with beta-barrel porin domain
MKSVDSRMGENTMTRLRTSTLAIAAVAALAAATGADSQTLATFSVLGASTVSNTGPTTIDGNVGLSPGLATAVIGFPPGLIAGTTYTGSDDGNNVAEDAQVELTNTYNTQAALPFDQDLSGQTLGADVSTLLPGVYSYSSSAQLTGQLTLDAQGDPNAVFVIQIGSTLTSASAASVVLANGAQGKNVYWIVGSSAVLGTGTSFAGQIMAADSITLTTGVTINCGAALAQTGAVTLDTNVITTICAFQGFASALGPTAVAVALDTFVNNGGILPASFQDLLNLPPEELAAALAQLSGETATAFTATGAEAMNSFLGAVLSPFDDTRQYPDERNSPDTVKALGYASEGKVADASPALAAFDQPLPRAQRPWSIWGSVYGGQTNTDGDPSAGTHDRSSRTLAFAMGLDYRVDPNAVVGFAVGGGGTSFGLSDSLGSGSSDMVQVAIYGRKSIDANYIATALAYAWHDVSTDRFLTIGAGEHYQANYGASNIAGRVEVGHHIDLPDDPRWPGAASITPYAALQVQGFFTPAYGETVVSGVPDFALNYAANDSVNIRTELGAMLARRFALANDAEFVLHLRAAWAHDYWSNNSSEATFQALPGSPSFTVEGATPASDSLLVSAGAEVDFNRAWSVAGSFDGAFADGSQTYGGKVKVRYTW